MQETGLKDAIWRKYYQKPMKEVTEGVENEKPLDIEHGFYLALIVWSIGMLIALLSFLMEMLLARN